MELKERVALVTGGSRGIGKAIVNLLAKEGAKVIINYHSSADSARELEKEINQSGGCALAIKADVTKNAEIRTMVKQTIDEFGRIECLINNAGILPGNSFLQTDEQEWDKVYEVNLKSMYYCCQAVIPQMLKQQFGRIVNMSSISGFRGTGAVAYSTTKAGIIGLTKSLAVEFAPQGILVNAVAPGLVETDMLASDPNGFVAIVRKTDPLKRLARPEEIAEAVCFLLKNDFVVGEVINVSGGRYTGH